jgi:hypothetical protein
MYPSKIKTMMLFLDDIRIPSDCSTYMHLRIGKDNTLYLKEWTIVKNYNEFIRTITDNYFIITHISFDHDLGEDVAIKLRNNGFSKRKARQSKKEVKSGYDCAKWMKEFYTKHSISQPILFVHSMNPTGTENIINLFKK